MSEEPQFMAVNSKTPAYQQTIAAAQSTLTEFRTLVPELLGTMAFPSVKTELRSGEDRAFIWLTVEGLSETGFIASIFEIPCEFSDLAVGDKIEVHNEAVLDWMYHDNGTIHGGFSLRYQRSLLPPEEQAAFDAHIGATDYA